MTDYNYSFYSNEPLSYVDYLKRVSAVDESQEIVQTIPRWAVEASKDINSLLSDCELGGFKVDVLDKEKIKSKLSLLNLNNNVDSIGDHAQVFSNLQMDEKVIENGALYIPPFLKNNIVELKSIICTLIITYNEEEKKYSLFDSILDEKEKEVELESIKNTTLLQALIGDFNHSYSESNRYNTYKTVVDNVSYDYNNYNSASFNAYKDKLIETINWIREAKLKHLNLVEVISSTQLIDIEETVISILLKSLGWVNTTPTN